MSLWQIWGSEMGKPHPVQLRERAIGLVKQGSTHTEAARRLCVSIKFVNDILDNLSSHKSSGAAKAMRDIGAWFLFRCSGKTPHWGLF